MDVHSCWTSEIIIFSESVSHIESKNISYISVIYQTCVPEKEQIVT